MQWYRSGVFFSPVHYICSTYSHTHIFSVFYTLPHKHEWSTEHKRLKFRELQGHSSLSLPPHHASLFGTVTHVNICMYRHLHSHIHAAVTVDMRVGNPAARLGFPHLKWPSGWWDFPLKETPITHYCSASKASNVGGIGDAIGSLQKPFIVLYFSFPCTVSYCINTLSLYLN